MPRWKNTADRFGVVTRVLHWILAVLILGLIGLGWWMVDLTYYDAWYNQSLALHDAFGIIVLVLSALRIGWVVVSPPPGPVASLRSWERFAARTTHRLFYVLAIVVPVSGFLVSTSEGDGVDWFGLLVVPPFVVLGDDARDLAIDVHYFGAYTIAGLAAMHAAAAVKHQLLDRDGTLRRMLW